MEYEAIHETEEDVCGSPGYVYQHPAFGMIRFSRVTGGDRILFGSSIKHNDKISLTIKQAKEHRSLHNDHYFGIRGNLIEVEMSYSQFAEAITSMNMGDGVPCTIRFTEKSGDIPNIIENNSKRAQFIKEFRDMIHEAMSQIQNVVNEVQDTLSSKKTLGVKDRKELISKLERAKHNIGLNLDFCYDQFNEQMDKTVQEAKGEIEAFCQNKINSIASATLVEHKDEVKMLTNPIEL